MAEVESINFLSLKMDAMVIILTQFLTINDVCKLDTSYCNKNKRIKLLDILSDKYIIYKQLNFDELFHNNVSIRSGYVNNFMKWISLRILKEYNRKLAFI